MDEPVADSAFITTYLVSEFARRDVTVILSGVGGDELFGGYRRYLGDHYQASFDRLPAWLRRAAIGAGRACRATVTRRCSIRCAWQRLPRKRRAAVRGALPRLRRGVPATARRACSARTRRRRSTASPRRSAHARSGDDALNRMLAWTPRRSSPTTSAMLTDKMSMAVSLECRVPLLDHELVELAARMPQEVKIRGGRLKHVMKEAARRLLPRDILERKKRGFGTPMGAWLKRDLAPVLRELLSPRPRSKRAACSTSEAVRELIARARARTASTAPTGCSR